MTQAPSDPEFVLRGVTGPVFGRSYNLLSPVTIGRSPECDIFLDEAGISRLHARLRPREMGLEIEDAGSTNGSFLNGQRITTAIARPGDEIAFDRLRFRVGQLPKPHREAAHAPTKPPASKGWMWAVAVALLAAGAGAFVAMR